MPRGKAKRRRENYGRGVTIKKIANWALLGLFHKSGIKKEIFSKIVKGLFDPVVSLFNYHDR
jgi:hypothetical protein